MNLDHEVSRRELCGALGGVFAFLTVIFGRQLPAGGERLFDVVLLGLLALLTVAFLATLALDSLHRRDQADER